MECEEKSQRICRASEVIIQNVARKPPCKSRRRLPYYYHKARSVDKNCAPVSVMAQISEVGKILLMANCVNIKIVAMTSSYFQPFASIYFLISCSNNLNWNPCRESPQSDRSDANADNVAKTVAKCLFNFI